MNFQLYVLIGVIACDKPSALFASRSYSFKAPSVCSDDDNGDDDDDFVDDDFVGMMMMIMVINRQHHHHRIILSVNGNTIARLGKSSFN